MSPLVENLIRTGIILVVAALAYLLAMRVGRRVVTRKVESGDDGGARAETLWTMGRRVIAIVIVATTVLLVIVTWGFSLAPFLAVGTVLAAAIGFGAQDLVKDVIAGFFILMEDQFHVGDSVRIADTTGTVEDIQLRVTVLRDFEGNVHFVPNGQISVTSNFTSEYAQPVIDISVDYGVDLDQALDILGDELTKLATDPEWAPRIHGEPEVLGVNALEDSGVQLRGRLTTLADERWSVRREAYRRIKNRFEAEGIPIPFPQLTIHKGD
ncbi:MAG: mechanosensitive ion channel family protein [Acidimicrobiia bacterium]|nr:mechanosensitive ion channel family protein [Acidimicrobiia bacterium]